MTDELNNEEEKIFLSDQDLNQILIRQERLINQKQAMDIMKLKAENIKLSQTIRELEAEKIGWNHEKQIQNIRTAKTAFNNKRESYNSFVELLSKKYGADLSHGFDDESGEVLTK